MATHDIDLIIIGAGLSGIIAAQRYLDCHPSANIILLEKEQDIGGVFTQRRLYDSFWTQWTHGLSEFFDFPMQRPPEEDTKFDLYKSEYFFKYLQQYVERKNEGGRTIRDRIIFEADVQLIEMMVDHGWKVSFMDSAKGIYVRTAPRLIVASGLCSVPNMPNLAGKESFGGPIIHSRDFGSESENITSGPGMKRVTVIGGGKSSADMIYEVIKKGDEKVQVDWIIRRNGTGPPFLAPGKGRGPFKNDFEAASTRLVAGLNPSIYNPKNMWTNFLASTKPGAGLLKMLISATDNGIRKEANYKGRKSDKGFEKLEYDTPFFWQNGPGGFLHHEDLWDILSQKVTIHRSEIQSLSHGAITLADGTTVPSDIILCGTGWKHSTASFFDTQTALSLGLPVPLTDEGEELNDKWAKLVHEADNDICAQYPLLAHPPPHYLAKPTTTPYRLYNSLLPLPLSASINPTIIFLSHISTGNSLIAAEVQAMWTVAYFNNHITLPPYQQMENSIARQIAFSRRRYLSNGQLGNGLNFESVVYADMLLRDIGIGGKGKGWWRDLVEPLRPAHLGEAWGEYLGRWRGEEREAEGNRDERDGGDD